MATDNLPNPMFIALFPLQEAIFDKDDGSHLSAGVVTFYEDNAPTVKKPVYQQSLSPSNEFIYTQLNNPIILTSIGTFADDNGNDIIPFLYPFTGTPGDGAPAIVDLYYITVEAAAPPVGTGALQFTREAWPPSAAIGTVTGNSFQPTENLLSNPQFVEVNFFNDPGATTHTYNVSGTNTVTPIAPDWEIVTTGTGTIVVGQVATVQNIGSNPPYLLDINSSGINTPFQLRQRLVESPRLLNGGFVSGFFVVGSLDAIDHDLTMKYTTSSGVVYQIANASTNTAGYNAISGTVAIDGTFNPDPATTGYVDITVDIPVNAHLQISSLQIVGVETINSSSEYIQESTGRQIDHLFHAYKPGLDYKPIPSYLTGWDFPLNPAQFGPSGTLGAISGDYICDQTILWQSSNNSMSWSIGGNDTSYRGLVITPIANGKFCLIQYLDATKAYDMRFQNLSAMVSMSTNGLPIPMTISLWYTTNASLPTITNTFVLTTDANGHPSSVVAGWHEIINQNGQATFTNPIGIDSYGFSGWLGEQIPSNVKFFAIVVGSGDINVAFTPIYDFFSISLVPGDVPTIPAPQTFDQVLHECEYYFESSYNLGTAAPNTTAGGIVYVLNELATGRVLTSATDQVYLQSFGLQYRVPKRIPVSPVLYALGSATPAQVTGRVLRNGANLIPSGVGAVGTSPQNYAQTNWSIQASGYKGVQFICINTTTKVYDSGLGTPPLEGDESLMQFHYVADARLGVV